MKFSRVAFVFTACFLSACATKNVIITEKRPQYHPVAATVGPEANAQAEIAGAMQRKPEDALTALGGFIAAADTASQHIKRNPRDAQALHDYNFAVARIMATIRNAQLDPWSKPLRVPSSRGEFALTRKPDPRSEWNPALYDIRPADEIDISGAYFTQRFARSGIGAPMVVVERGVNAASGKNFTPPRRYYGITVVARFDGSRCVLSFEDPLAVETARVDGRTYPLAADFSAPIAVMLASNDPKKYELTRLRDPEKYAGTARIIALQPYDPNRTVVLFVHGLMDTQATWIPMINNLRGDPYIRRHYQFWFYTYPSGYPYPYSAAILRHELDKIEKRYPLRHKMVVIGHSMGGSISRLLITDTGDKVWEGIFRKTPEQTPMSPENKKLLIDSLIFKHRPEIGRVIFISAPLKGSELAEIKIGRIGSMFVKSPATLLKAGNEAIKSVALQPGDLALKRIPNSVDTLAPNNRFVEVINEVPITSGIPYHVIGGDRGKGGNKDHTKPVMSDGVVPYWSYHMDGAKSELIVPSGHGAHRNPQAIAEVDRILKLNAKDN